MNISQGTFQNRFCKPKAQEVHGKRLQKKRWACCRKASRGGKALKFPTSLIKFAEKKI